MLPVALALAALVLAYIAIAIVLIPPEKPRNFNFVDERGAITVLSAIFLAMASGFGFATFTLSQGSAQGVRWFWFLATLALGFLALDELLTFHERIGDRLDRIDFLGWTSSKTIRGWNDMVVIAYGVIALPISVVLLPTIAKYPTFLKLFCTAFACYVLHTAIDSIVEPPTTISVICEESFKLYCSMCLALACFVGLLTHAGKMPSSAPQSESR